MSHQTAILKSSGSVLLLFPKVRFSKIISASRINEVFFYPVHKGDTSLKGKESFFVNRLKNCVEFENIN